MVVNDSMKLLDMRDAAEYLSQTYRWLQRNYLQLTREGVEVLRMPKESKKGHLMFEQGSLDRYLKNCRLKLDTGAIKDL